MTEASSKAWAKAAAELDSTDRDMALWAREFSNADGDENKAKAAYLRIRAEAFSKSEGRDNRSLSSGFQTNVSERRKTSKLTWLVAVVGGIIIVFFVVAMIAGSGPEAEARATERRAIELCWSNQAKKSLDPSAARFIAGACERMESDFRAKHNLSP